MVSSLTSDRQRKCKGDIEIERPFLWNLAVLHVFPQTWERIAVTSEPGWVSWEAEAQVSSVWLGMEGAPQNAPE